MNSDEKFWIAMWGMVLASVTIISTTAIVVCSNNQTRTKIEAFKAGYVEANDPTQSTHWTKKD